MRKIIIHYHRQDQEYDPWGVWLWPEGYGGQWVPFDEEDSFGRIAVCEVPKKHGRLGFVIRGESWEKDIDQDRYIEDFIGDLGEIWLVAGDPTVYLAPPAHLRNDVRAFTELELTVHYYRHDGDYEGWNLWIWGHGEPGRSLDFIGSDDYGLIARVILTQQTDGDEIGFVLRKSVVGNGWFARDGSCDRFIPLYRTDNDGQLHLWLMQDDPHLYYRAKDVDRMPRLNVVSLDDEEIVRVETYLPVKANLGEYWGFVLREKQSGKGIELAQVRPCYPQGKEPRCFILQTKEPLDLCKHYIVEHSTHGTKELRFGKIFSSSAFKEKFHYPGQDLGVTYTAKATTFKVWAPTASDLAVLLYREDTGGVGESHRLVRGEKGVWSLSIKEDLEGCYYTYRVTHEEQSFEVVDPYARTCGVNGKRGQIVNLEKINPPGWNTVSMIPLENPVDALIYEVHIRDFSYSENSGIKAKGQYLGMVEEGTITSTGIKTGLDHLKELGITHVHLLPIFDFATVDEGNPKDGYNWGYDPLNYNAPEGSYASDPHDGRVRIKELKTLVQGLNKAGIGAIMDVVYNHSFHSVASSLNSLVPGYYYRLHKNGSFSNGSGCGNELADERSMVRKFIVDSVTYWAKEYKLSGFRFDLMGLHHLETMEAVRRALSQIDPQILVYGEGWAAASSTLPEQERALKENTPALPGIASFCNDLRDGVKGHVFHTREGGFIQGQGFEETVKFGIVAAIWHPQIDYSKVLYSKKPWALEPSQAVLYVEAHDNLTLWDKLLCTTAPFAHDERLNMMKLAQTIVLTSQGIPLLHAGQEFARSKDGDHNSYQSPDHINQIDWERKGEFRELYEYTRDLIALRKRYPAFRLGSAVQIREKLQFLSLNYGNMVGYVLGPFERGDGEEQILVFFNGNATPVEVEVEPGPWEILVNEEGVGDSLGTLMGPKVWVQGYSPLLLIRRERRE